MPEISVILCTRNRARLLPKVLDGLGCQSLPEDDFEIVAIDDGSTDETQEILNVAAGSLPLRNFRQNNAGLAAAKNLGVFASRSPTLLFLDDDDVAEPGLLAAHVIAQRNNPAPEIAVLGHTRLAPEVACSPLMRHVTQVGCQLFSYCELSPDAKLDYTHFWGGRSSCKRGFLIDRGIFNPVFTFGCEDIELGWRLSKHGLRVVYEPTAASVMIRTLTFGDFCSRSIRQGLSQWRFAQFHPDEAVRSYCKIDQALRTWSKYMGRFSQFRHWVERLDALALVRRQAGLPLDERFEHTLNEAYRAAFFLCCAKGISDAAQA